jgi:hypothetical protein
MLDHKMNTFLIYSDEYGNYSQQKPDLKSHPYYVRSGVMIKADEWKKMTDEFIKLKIEYDLPLDKEIKWSYPWSLRKCTKENVTPSKKRDYYFLKDYPYHKLIEFVSRALCILAGLKFCKVIFTITDNALTPRPNDCDFLKMHLQNIMQRTQFELQVKKNNLGILFIDDIENKKNKALKDACFQILKNGDFIKDYSCLIDSIQIDYSHQSIGLQMADYAAGAFGSYIKGFKDFDSYKLGIKMFKENLFPILRKSNENEYFGWGIIVVPKQDSFKSYLKKEFSKDLGI